MLLCMAMLMAFAVPAAAAEETNELGATFQAVLDQPEIEESSEDQTVVMTVKTSHPVIVDGMEIYVELDEPLTVAEVSGGEQIPGFDAGDYNKEDGIVSWSSPDAENVSGVTELIRVSITVPADTEPGTYTVGVSGIELTSDYGNIWESGAYAQTTLTIIDVPEVTSYCASLSTTTADVTRGDQVVVSVDVTHVNETIFHAGELVLSYDPAFLSLSEADCRLGGASVKAEEGNLTLEDYGAAKNCGSSVYVLVFDSLVNGNTEVELVSCAFSNQENAASGDLTEGVVYPASVAIAIGKKSYPVTLPAGISGSAYVVEGNDYTFTISDLNYDYADFEATVDEETVEIIDNGDGSYTVSSVNGELVITVNATPKSYNVSFIGSAAAEITGSQTAVYGSAYSFTVPTVTGWAYSLDDVSIDGASYTGYTVSGNTYTIPGAAITGDILISVNKSQVSTAVTVEGSGAGAAAGYAVAANVGQPYTLSITPEIGYNYTVTATMGGQPVELIQDGNNYTIASVSADIVFTVLRNAAVNQVSVSEFLSVSGAKIWLVKNGITVAEGKVPTYDGQPMFWSEAYGAYCCLVIAESLDGENAKAKIDIAEGAATALVYDKDVNMTGKVDANDAQLTYDLYNAVYSEFTDVVTMEKVLRADVNLDEKVNVEDAAAIIAFILT